MSRARAAVILAAGQGTRMKSALPKPLHAVGGRAMLDWAIAAAHGAGCEQLIVVTGAHAPAVGAHVTKALGPDAIAIQDPPLGTGHAVRAAESALADFHGDVVVLYADAPLITAETLEKLFALRAEARGLAVLGFEAADPFGYGRLVLAEDGAVARIVEEKDATDAEKAITLCNSGVVVADCKVLFQLLSMLRNDNAKGEYYLTDVVGLGHAAGFATHALRCDEAEVLGVNARDELAEAEAAFQQRTRAAMMKAGVTLIDPSTVYFSFDTVIAEDVLVEPSVFFGPGVSVARGARIKAFSHIEGASVGEEAQVGPFARLRPGAKLGRKTKIGNFVEVKNASFDERAVANHLSYIGDADIGPRVNIGAGTITCNYDGYGKFRTKIDADAFIGSNTALVAPVTVGARAYTASGSVIVTDVPEGALSIARERQRDIPGWADAFRARHPAKKPD